LKTTNAAVISKNETIPHDKLLLSLLRKEKKWKTFVIAIQNMFSNRRNCLLFVLLGRAENAINKTQREKA
jgi:hypothetical protein